MSDPPPGLGDLPPARGRHRRSGVPTRAPLAGGARGDVRGGRRAHAGRVRAVAAARRRLLGSRRAAFGRRRPARHARRALLLVGFSPFDEDSSDGEVALGITFALNVLFVIAAILKGRTVLGVVGLFVPIVAFVATCRLARPRSPWARRFYAAGSRRLERSRKTVPLRPPHALGADRRPLRGHASRSHRGRPAVGKGLCDFTVRWPARRPGRAMMRSVTTNPLGETPDVGIPRRLAASMTIGEQHDWLRASSPPSGEPALRAEGRPASSRRSGSPPRRGPSRRARRPRRPVSVVGRHLAFGDDPTSSMSMAGELTAAPPPGSSWSSARTASSADRRGVRHLVSQVPQADGSVRGSDQYFVHALASGLAPGRATTTASVCRTARPPRPPPSAPRRAPRPRRGASPRSPTRVSTWSRRAGCPGSPTATTSPTTPAGP